MIDSAISALNTALAEVHILSRAGWKRRFQEDTHPKRQMAFWLHVALGYQRRTAGRELSRDERDDAYLDALEADNPFLMHCPPPPHKRVKEMIAELTK